MFLALLLFSLTLLVNVSTRVFLQVLVWPPSLPGEGEEEVERGRHESQAAEHSEGVPHSQLLNDQTAHQTAHRLAYSEI